MARRTHADRIHELLSRRPGLDDDQLAKALGISPRQTVNMVCRKEVERGLLRRIPGPHGKIVNVPVTGANAPRPAPWPARQVAPRLVPRPPPRPTRAPVVWTRPDLARTLIVLPCSGSKASGGVAGTPASSILEDLPPDLSRDLLRAREHVHRGASVDETRRLPAWQRYSGFLYRAASPSLRRHVESGGHVLILSGGYGVVRADEPIGTYQKVLRSRDWPRGLLEAVLVAYARRHGCKRMRAFVAASTGYRKVLQRTPWGRTEVTDRVILSPICGRGGAMVKGPRTQGEALAAFLEGSLTSGWCSSDGLGLQAT